jgi:hypothetical protein
MAISSSRVVLLPQRRDPAFPCHCWSSTTSSVIQVVECSNRLAQCTCHRVSMIKEKEICSLSYDHSQSSTVQQSTSDEFCNAAWTIDGDGCQCLGLEKGETPKTSRSFLPEASSNRVRLLALASGARHHDDSIVVGTLLSNGLAAQLR